MNRWQLFAHLVWLIGEIRGTDASAGRDVPSTRRQHGQWYDGVAEQVKPRHRKQPLTVVHLEPYLPLADMEACREATPSAW